MDEQRIREIVREEIEAQLAKPINIAVKTDTDGLAAYVCGELAKHSTRSE